MCPLPRHALQCVIHALHFTLNVVASVHEIPIVEKPGQIGHELDSLLS